MTPTETTTILRNYNEWLRGSDDALRPTTKEIGEAIDAAVEMIERMEKMEAALQGHHANAMCKGCDHSHPLTQLRLAAYQQSKLHADTVFVLEESK